MNSVQESNLYRIWMAICLLYDESLLCRVLKVMGRWCNRQIDESGILRVLCREGVVARSWGKLAGVQSFDVFGEPSGNFAAQAVLRLSKSV